MKNSQRPKISDHVAQTLKTPFSFYESDEFGAHVIIEDAANETVLEVVTQTHDEDTYASYVVKVLNERADIKAVLAQQRANAESRNAINDMNERNIAHGMFKILNAIERVMG